MTYSPDTRNAIILLVFGAVISSLIALTLLANYAQPTDYLLYRLALNVSQGHGIAYNTDASTLVTFSPGMPLILSPAAPTPDMLAALISIAALSLATPLIYSRLRQSDLSMSLAFLGVLLWLFQWPLWLSLRSPALIVMLLVLLALNAVHHARWRTGGFLAGIGLLFQPEAIVPAILIGLYTSRFTQGSRYWQTVWIPGVTWGVAAALMYESLQFEPDYGTLSWQGGLWLVAFLLGLLSMTSYTGQKSVLWLFPVWAAAEIVLRFALTGQFPELNSPALALTVMLGLVSFVQNSKLQLRHVLGIGSGFVLAGVIILAPPETDTEVVQAQARATKLDIPSEASIAHTYGDALPYYLQGFSGAAHRLDGRRNRQIQTYRQQDDHASVLIRYAPDYVITHESTDWIASTIEKPDVAPLSYSQVDSGVYARGAPSRAAWDTMTETNLDYGIDVTLTGTEADHDHLQAGKPVRVALHWHTENTPDNPDERLGFNLSLLDTSRVPVSSIFPDRPASILNQHETTTYHALPVPDDTPPGVYKLNVGLNANAGTLGQHDVMQLPLPFPEDTVPDGESQGDLGLVQLQGHTVEYDGSTLTITTQWRVIQDITASYNVFLHITSPDSPQPLAQADGPPVSGRYPTEHWKTGDPIVDTRNVDVSELAPGMYQITIGFFQLEGGRMVGPDGNALGIARIEVDSGGSVTLVE